MIFDLQDIKKLDIDKLGFFRFKKFDDNQYLLTNDAGKFHFLSTSDFQKFISGNIEKLPDYTQLVQKGFIKDASYIEKMTGSVAMKNHFVGLGPALHMIVTTLRCNHKCKYCHAAVAPMTATEFDMDKQTARKVVDTIFYSNNPHVAIEFQGGESLVNYEIVQYIVEYAQTKAIHLNKNLSFSLVSNLTLMTEEKLTWLLDNDVSVCTSLDGNKLNHNNNRTGYDGDSFDTVTYWINKINQEQSKRKMGKIGCLMTVTAENIPHYKDLIDGYLDLDLDGIFLRWLNPYGFAAAEINTLAYDSEDWIDFYIKSMEYIIEINKTGRKFSEYITTMYLRKIFGVQDPNFMDIRSPGGLATGGVAYNYDGKVYASDESRMLGRMGIDDFLMTPMLQDGESTYKAMMESDITKIAIQSSTLDGLPDYNDHVYKPYLGVDIIHNFKMEGNLFHPMVLDEKMKIQIAILDYIFEKLQDSTVKKIFDSWIAE